MEESKGRYREKIDEFVVSSRIRNTVAEALLKAGYEIDAELVEYTPEEAMVRLKVYSTRL